METSLTPPQIHATIIDDQNKVTVRDYEDIISTLPRQISRISVFYYRRYQGFWFAEEVIPQIMEVQETFLAKSTDIIVATPPKTGTTWLKALTFAIATRNCFDDSTTPLLVKVPHACFPYLELDNLEGNDGTTNPEIPLFSTHLPYTSLPNSIIQQGCKIVFLWRDIKDAFVSYWFFTLHNVKSLGVKDDQLVSIEDVFEEFCQPIGTMF